MKNKNEFKSKDEGLKAICEHCEYGLDEHDADFKCFNEKPQHTPTPGKMREILVGMTHDGYVSDHTILIALESEDDPLRAYIVKAVNCHEELLKAAKEMVEALNKQKYGERKEGQLEAFFALNAAIAKAEGK
jgi:hypothetical protein